MSETTNDPKLLLKEFSVAGWQDQQQMSTFIQRAVSGQNFPIKKAIPLLTETNGGSNTLLLKRRLHCFEQIASTMKHKEVGEILLTVLPDVPSSVQAVLIRVLKQVNNAAWHTRALKFLHHKDPAVRRTGRDLCSQVGGKTMFQLLSTGLKSRTLKPNGETLETLVRIAGHHALGVFTEVFSQCEKPQRLAILNLASDLEFMKAARKSAAAFIIACFEDPDQSVVNAAIKSLAKVGTAEHLPVLKDLAYMPDSPYLETILHAVGKLGSGDDREVVDLLEMGVRSRRLNIKLIAIEALHDIGTEDVLDPLSLGLRDTNLQVRQKTADVFVRLAKNRQINIGRLLIFLLREREANVRRIAVEIIDMLADEVQDLWQRLISALRDEDWWVRERVTDVLIKMGNEEIVRHILTLLDDPKEIVRRYAIEVLVRLKHRSAVSKLIKAVSDDPDWWVRERAVEALGELGGSESVPVLMQVLQEEELRWVTVRAFGKIKPKEAVPHLLKLLKTGAPEFRIDLLETLNAIGDPQMINPILELQYDVDRNVRNKAVEILRAHQVKIEAEEEYLKKAQHLTVLDRMLMQTKRKGATDLFLHSGMKPCIRFLSDVIPASEQRLSTEKVEELIKPILPEDKVAELAERGDTDFSYEIQGEKSRFRVNVYRQRSGLSAVFRVLTDSISKLGSLGFSDHVVNLTRHHQGLVLVTGPAGSGKTTTLMAMIDHINATRNAHIITLEDPVEYILDSKQCLINQREIGKSTHSFGSGLRAALREDPDVILIGEMRDLETFSIAIKAAETGHLVLGTLHTLGAAQTIDRIVDVFPHEQQGQIRSMVSQSLKGVITQQLIKKKACEERILVTEIMIMNDAISNMIRKEKTYQISSILTTGKEQGMHSMDMELIALVEKGDVEFEDALMKAVNKKEFEAHFHVDEEKKDKPASAAKEQ